MIPPLPSRCYPLWDCCHSFLSCLHRLPSWFLRHWLSPPSFFSFLLRWRPRFGRRSCYNFRGRQPQSWLLPHHPTLLPRCLSSHSAIPPGARCACSSQKLRRRAPSSLSWRRRNCLLCNLGLHSILLAQIEAEWLSSGSDHSKRGGAENYGQVPQLFARRRLWLWLYTGTVLWDAYRACADPRGSGGSIVSWWGWVHGDYGHHGGLSCRLHQ